MLSRYCLCLAGNQEFKFVLFDQMLAKLRGRELTSRRAKRTKEMQKKLAKLSFVHFISVPIWTVPSVAKNTVPVGI